MQNNIRQNIETEINQKLTDAEFEKLNGWFVPTQLRMPTLKKLVGEFRNLKCFLEYLFKMVI